MIKSKAKAFKVLALINKYIDYFGFISDENLNRIVLDKLFSLILKRFTSEMEAIIGYEPSFKQREQFDFFLINGEICCCNEYIDLIGDEYDYFFNLKRSYNGLDTNYDYRKFHTFEVYDFVPDYQRNIKKEGYFDDSDLHFFDEELQYNPKFLDYIEQMYACIEYPVQMLVLKNRVLPNAKRYYKNNSNCKDKELFDKLLIAEKNITFSGDDGFSFQLETNDAWYGFIFYGELNPNWRRSFEGFDTQCTILFQRLWMDVALVYLNNKYHFTKDRYSSYIK